MDNLHVTDISIKSLLEMSGGDTTGSFLVIVKPNGLFFQYVTRDELALIKSAGQEATA